MFPTEILCGHTCQIVPEYKNDNCHPRPEAPCRGVTVGCSQDARVSEEKHLLTPRDFIRTKSGVGEETPLQTPTRNWPEYILRNSQVPGLLAAETNQPV